MFGVDFGVANIAVSSIVTDKQWSVKSLGDKRIAVFQPPTPSQRRRSNLDVPGSLPVYHTPGIHPCAVLHSVENDRPLVGDCPAEGVMSAMIELPLQEAVSALSKAHRTKTAYCIDRSTKTSFSVESQSERANMFEMFETEECIWLVPVYYY
jgi:hypothetical protein